ncbi:hypothetical protein AGR8A_Lc10083 [Agrobacterium fabrum str. J-07]|nr:hypothetical protein AGR8A_Lc10083 [Agrobacterium fabrum str. J-07]
MASSDPSLPELPEPNCPRRVILIYFPIAARRRHARYGIDIRWIGTTPHRPSGCVLRQTNSPADANLSKEDTAKPKMQLTVIPWLFSMSR